jgi:DEAD/DEAH box helicase domain-containing protein
MASQAEIRKTLTNAVENDLVAALRSNPSLANQITEVITLREVPAKLMQPTAPMHTRLRETLSQLGIKELYDHQALAYDMVSAGEDIAVVTGTNSGKTLCYNLPVLQRCLTEPMARALYLYPTKALAQDQLSKFLELAPGGEIRAAVYDGDTPKSQRPAIRKLSHVVLSNPDMLHIGILPSHENWGKFLKSLRIIVIDEMHVYRGVFGSHVAGVVRRLLRLCEWRGSRPQIVACSATIGNPGDVFRRLTGRTCKLITEDGSPKGRRTFVFWNPPRLEDETRQSTNIVSSEIVATLCESGLRSMAFCRARVTAELLLRYTRERLTRAGNVQAEKVESYRAGYTPKERRKIEKSLFKGETLAVATTSAMELGVDIGGLDAVVMNGYPGSISSFWQQAGRAGRGTRDGLAIMVAHDDPLEQFLVSEPHRVLEGSNETVALNPDNSQILAQQIRCAAFERPIYPSELERFGPNALAVAEGLDRAGELPFQAGVFVYPDYESPASKVSIRGTGGSHVTLIADGEELGTMERWRAMQSAHEGAVYLHRGASYLVESLDLAKGVAQVIKRGVPFYTQAVVQSTLDPQLDIELRTWGRHDARLAALKVTDLVIGYKQIALEGLSMLAIHPLEMPPVSYETIGIRLDLPEVEEDDPAGIASIHALEHTLMAVAPLMAGCDRSDLGSAWYSMFPGSLKPALFIFDRTPGGVGLVEALFGQLGMWANAALQVLAHCPCIEGCPSCLLSSRCEANNELLSKKGAACLLQNLMQRSQ